MLLSQLSLAASKATSSFDTDSENISPSLHTSHIRFNWYEGSGSGIASSSVQSVHHGEIPREAQALWVKKEDCWPLGHAITVIVAQCAEQWVQDANISFRFLATKANNHDIGSADVRITFQPGISWSVVGTQALRLPGRTMNLAVEPWHAADQIRRMAFHELGHALGFRHEHASPACNLNFDKAKWMIDTGKTEEDFDANFGKRVDDRPRLVSKFDRQSIMIYEILPEGSWERAPLLFNLAPNSSFFDLAPNSRFLDLAPNSRFLDLAPNSRFLDLAPNSRFLDLAPNSRFLGLTPNSRYLDLAPNVRLFRLRILTRGYQIFPAFREMPNYS
ncbi:hypothetical protein FGADI_6460 [Fusarium gaditjirri]|uniref:Peptidase M12A domain-containing protein n=1 Tax=Fusarium gaditjirri TaxID=282569 RepID=A0A8H4T7N1_9HYPO|nr:hypothetical protein FGADI_6460 [Fusarium gaditjirri]